jgi:hypothetical protein
MSYEQIFGRPENKIWTKAGQMKENMTAPRLKNGFLLFFSNFSWRFFISVVNTSNLA